MQQKIGKEEEVNWFEGPTFVDVMDLWITEAEKEESLEECQKYRKNTLKAQVNALTMEESENEETDAEKQIQELESKETEILEEIQRLEAELEETEKEINSPEQTPDIPVSEPAVEVAQEHSRVIIYLKNPQTLNITCQQKQVH